MLDTLAETLPAEPPPTPSRRLHVVMVDEELPYPPVSGKRIRTLNLTLRLAARHRITYVCHRNADPAEARQAAAYFADHGVRTVVVDRPVRRKQGPGFYARLGANLFSPLPYSVASHTSPALRRALVDLAGREPVDLWHCEWTPYAESVRGLPGRHLVMAHNVESVIWQRYRETEPNALKRWYIGRQYAKFVRFERRAVGEADCTVAVSELDAGRLRADFGARSVEVVDNGVDPAYFRPGDGPRLPGRLLFLGSLEWRPNLDAVRVLLDGVFPAVRAARPDATLALVGRNPPEWLRREAARVPGVELHGDVADVRPFLTECAALVVPLRVGGGSRLKILEALACGTPVVSTRVGAEGLHLEPGRHLTVADDIGGLPGALLETLRDPESAGRQAANGRREVLRRYDWDRLADNLERVWLRCAGAEGGAGTGRPVAPRAARVLTDVPGKPGYFWGEHTTFVGPYRPPAWLRRLVGGGCAHNLTGAAAALRLFARRGGCAGVVTDGGSSGMLFAWLQAACPWGRVRHVVVDCLWQRSPSRLLHAFKRLRLGLANRSVDHFVVWAAHEVEDYAEAFGLPREKLRYVPFHQTLTGYDYEVTDGDYLFAGGDSDRDYHTLVEAVRGLDVPVWIATTRARQFAGTDMPANVRVERTTAEGFRHAMAACRMNVVAMAPGLVHSGGQQTLLNGMALGKPTIAVGRRWATDYVRDGVDGLIVDYGDVAGFRRAVRWVLDHPEEAARMGARARATAAYFTTERTMRAVYALATGDSEPSAQPPAREGTGLAG